MLVLCYLSHSFLDDAILSGEVPCIDMVLVVEAPKQRVSVTGFINCMRIPKGQTLGQIDGDIMMAMANIPNQCACRINV